MESCIQISKINDFIFCPKSVYLHSIFQKFSEITYHDIPQTTGKIKHKNIDNKKYSTSRHILQGMPIYNSHYGLCGKIDIYNSLEKILIERKSKITTIYDGYKYQLYAQYFCLIEMGYKVNKIFLHSLSDNRRYEICLPNKTETKCFENVLSKMKNFTWSQNQGISISPAKCNKCIYSGLCF